MPQITCPNCGTTINLEKRREVDFTMIRHATDRSPRTFTELLRITKLSRKTLNLRLKELCAEGFLMKEEGMYKSNGKFEYGNNGGNLVKSLSRVFDDRRLQTGLVLVALLASFSVSGYVLATMIAPVTYVQHYEPPEPLGTFTMAINVDNVNDLYGWQVAIAFNATQMKVTAAESGEFMKVEYPFFESATSTSPSLFFGTLQGNVAGKSGSGTLATIVFEYYVNNYELPSMESSMAGYDTWLKDSAGADIPGGQSLLTLTIVG